ncbi:hypothetical protein [Methylomicrobium sp. Wu6]|uniref:hypothetical protein n=1 Tax=Methylomicrobium sp. Wu6 TaxID=3107928 RepID=UPI002DD64321|nr:hypothetical protein [Methylomicrobium sp. Wu6]MEC4747718.1 hypothetical protein [Methylomicrobium sp. Wu6]
MANDDLKLPELLIDGQKIDGRTAIARRYRDQLAGLNYQVGGEPTTAEAMLMRRAATLAVLCERDELRILNGEEIDEANYRQNASHLRGALINLGMIKKSRDIKQSDYRTFDAHTAAVLESD